MLSLDGRFKTRGLQVVSVTEYDKDDGDEEKEKIAEAAREEKMTYPCYLDVEGAWAKANGVAKIPAFLVVGKDGRARYLHRGKLTEGTAEFDALVKAIEEALAAPG